MQHCCIASETLTIFRYFNISYYISNLMFHTATFWNVVFIILKLV
jgi:hypothetical protein